MNLVILLAVADAFYSGYILSLAKEHDLKIEELNPIGNFIFKKLGFLYGSAVLAALAAFVVSTLLAWNPDGSQLLLGVYFAVSYYHLLVGVKVSGVIERIKVLREAGVGEV